VDNNYQRPLGNRMEIYDAYVEGKVPPSIDLGVRGDLVRTDGKNKRDYIISSPTYIIDGWQRVGIALKYMENNPGHTVRIFAMVHFGTTDLWERHRFTELNKGVRKVSPNLMLRNMRDTNDVVLTLYGLSNNTQTFAAYRRVSWGQKVNKGELMTALVLLKTAERLHQHVTEGVPLKKGSVGGNKDGHSGTAGVLSQRAFMLSKQVGLNNFRLNVADLFEVVDECWGIREVTSSKNAPQVHGGFLDVLAKFFDVHTDFWNGPRLVVTIPQKSKLKKFNLQDPYLRNLTGGKSTGQNILYQMLVDHYNSGRRTGHLTQRYGAKSVKNG
jgi:hypothetical protein